VGFGPLDAREPRVVTVVRATLRLVEHGGHELGDAAAATTEFHDLGAGSGNHAEAQDVEDHGVAHEVVSLQRGATRDVLDEGLVDLGPEPIGGDGEEEERVLQQVPLGTAVS